MSCYGLKPMKMSQLPPWTYSRDQATETSQHTAFEVLTSKTLLAELTYTLSFQAIVLYKCNFANGCDIKIL
jgi:hypothetical protein